MHKLKFYVLSFGLVFCILHSAFTCYAQPIHSTELINNAKQYDGQVVVYEGEIIGDIMRRGDYAWVNVLEGTNAVGIWVERPLLKDIAFTGGYKSIGDKVEVTGVFHRVCPEHGGDLDIHAEALRVTSRGRVITESPNLNKRNMGVALLGVLCLVWILNLFIRK